MSDQNVSRKVWVAVGVAGGLILGGIMSFVVSFCIVWQKTCLEGCMTEPGSEGTFIWIFNTACSFGLIGAIAGAIIMGIVVNWRLRQHRPEDQSAATDVHHPPGGDAVEE